MRADDLINLMDSFVGVTEKPPGSNRTPIGEEYGWNGVAWCAETISVACRRLGFPLHEASVIRIENHGRAGDWGMGWTRTPTRGAAVCFDFGGRGNPADMHTGVVSAVLNPTQFRTIEGNHHDRCEREIRDMKFVRGFATFPFEAGGVPASQPSQDQPQSQSPPASSGSDLTEKLMQAPVLRENSSDRHHVGIMQALLTWHAPDLTGDKNTFVDGAFGSHTTQVLTEWQRRTTVLKPDGECGEHTWAWLCGV
jgi:peptidoglycan hydrolase-like protein with peptidoglycan-binding domain